MSFDANRRRLLALIGVAASGLAPSRLLAQISSSPGEVPGNPDGLVINDIGPWRIVSQANNSRAFLIDEKIVVRAARTGSDEDAPGGYAELGLEYWSVGTSGYDGAITVDTLRSPRTAIPTKVFIDGNQVDAFDTLISEKRDLETYFGDGLAGLAAARSITVTMEFDGETLTVFEASLVGAGEALAAMRTIPDYNYNVSGLGRDSAPSQGCFLTSACCDQVGLADDCFELRTLRGFRDRVLAVTVDGRRDIRLYYQLAPQILAEMARRGEAGRLRRLYVTDILPSAVLVRLGAHRQAHRLYTRMMRRLTRRYLPGKARSGAGWTATEGWR
jgi:hypothetical protein